MAEYIVNINEDVLGEFDFIAVESLTKGTPLIRCRECKWYEIDKPHYCGFGGHGHRLESDFCSDAERKEE